MNGEVGLLGEGLQGVVLDGGPLGHHEAKQTIGRCADRVLVVLPVGDRRGVDAHVLGEVSPGPAEHLAQEPDLGSRETSLLVDHGVGDELIQLGHPGEHQLVVTARRTPANLDAYENDVRQTRLLVEVGLRLRGQLGLAARPALLRHGRRPCCLGSVRHRAATLHLVVRPC